MSRDLKEEIKDFLEINLQTPEQEEKLMELIEEYRYDSMNEGYAMGRNTGEGQGLDTAINETNKLLDALYKAQG